MAEKITEDELYNRIIQRKPELKSFDKTEILNRVYQRKPELRDAVISVKTTEPLPKQEPSIGAGKATSIRPLTGVERAAEYMPAVGAAIGGTMGLVSPIPGGAAIGAGLGAGVGKATEMFMRGGPATSGERALDISKEASGAMLGEAAFPIGIKGASIAFKAIKDPIKRVGAGLASAARGSKSSYESIARFIQGEGVEQSLKEGKEVVSGMRVKDPMTRLVTAVEKNAADSFNKVQTSIEGYRSQLGKAVERVDNALINKMKDVTIDMSKRADDYIGKVNSLLTDDRMAPYAKSPDLVKIQEFANNLKTSPYADMDSIIKFRKMLDENINWKPGNLVGEKRPDAVEAVLKDIRGDIRGIISREASKKKFGVYDKIYSKFSGFADNWDSTLKQVYSTADESGLATSRGLDKFVNYFNRSGYKADVLEDTTKYLPPQARKDVEKLLDNSAAYNLLAEIGAPSSPMAGIMREMLINPTTLKMLKAGDPIEKVLQSHLVRKAASPVGAVAGTQMTNTK